MTPCEFEVRGLALKPANIIVPVIVVPGIMGSNLRAKIKPRTEEEENRQVGPGKPAWRPPNTAPGGAWDSSDWKDGSPAERQKLFDPATLEVDPGGPVHLPHGDGRLHVRPQEARERWWGEVHNDSYGPLLCALRTRLNSTFRRDGPEGTRRIADHWREVMDCDPQRWGVRRMQPLSEAELEKHARHHFPVYACGYNFFESNGKSSQRLEQRILEIIDSWKKMNFQCDQVILVTHSMGGLVARACAKRIPEKIAGVIHGVMPALGAPAAYRRIACGTESSSPSNSDFENFKAGRAAKLLGSTTEKTTPVLATSAGGLELLPNHLYPAPWLYARVTTKTGSADKPANLDCLSLPGGQITNPYDLYQDFTSWYRLIDLALADPAGKYARVAGGVERQIKKAIKTAEQFHRALGDYYHPKTYVFYGDDPGKLSFGWVRWSAQREGGGVPITVANTAQAKFLGRTEAGGRRVSIEGKTELHFAPEEQKTAGDGTVPRQSGAGPEGKVRRVFQTRGYDHQGAYNHNDMLMLTLRLIVKIVQEISHETSLSK
jgi:pimeloyl-ACP methyl ester carboxylesterase